MVPDNQMMHVVLPTELWLQIFEQSWFLSRDYLWTTVRVVSHRYKDVVERIFVSTYLPGFAISLSLPRYNSESGALAWPVAVNNTSIVMAFDSISSDREHALFISPCTVTVGTAPRSMEDLRKQNIMPLKRLQDAPAWVYTNKNYGGGISLKIPRHIDWDAERELWGWKVEWRTLVSNFYRAKEAARYKPRFVASGKNGLRGVRG
ncbi:hypothetical protein CC86DRAFT_374884 [Ophiobolus disseminans]|uniref:Uncharacterized protein n=1 Tax=Ophiobolus disseminans TaxID=1469910 RepID=A0A6A6ZF54_9PLEO|nr:hypothetical protein CC86DRAFT_374884 [Ophiobolus disseminans]